MSTVSNEGFMMQCRAFTAILSTVVIPPPKINQAGLAVPETPIKTSIFIG